MSGAAKLTPSERRLSPLDRQAKLDADVERCTRKVLAWARKLDAARVKLARARAAAARPR